VNAGDVNGDGFDDMIIGAYTSYREPTATTDAEYNIGRAYVVFVSGDGTTPVRNLGTLDASEGFALGGIAAGDRTSAMSPA
jgi:glycosylphosphatidylinositol phospholipase D